ncbi:uncharacterized protein LOC132743732, partial [Ruditapes philippinarum]|uniref:uncharacterized protein LOC132743732 n=1 Tax=Ruditapes philippinarum TaxID=129788 RepID=UPI00295A6CD5
MAKSGDSLQEKDGVYGCVKDILCKPCLSKDKQTVADKFCSTCNEFQCTECSNVHDVLSFLKPHKLVSSNEAVTKQDSFDMKGLDRCNQHKKLIKFFCEDENQLCCSTCAIVGHRKCDSVVEIQKLAGKMMSPNSPVKEKLLDTKEMAKGIIKQVMTAKEKLDADVKKIPETINQVRDEVIRMFDDLEISIVKKVKSFHDETRTKIAINQSQTENYLSDVRTRLETIDSVYRNGSPAQQFIVEKKMENDAASLYRNVNEVFENLETFSVSFRFDETLKLPPFPVTEYVPGQIAFQHHYVNRPMTLTPVSSIDLKKTGDDTNEPHFTGIDFLSDGRLVAVDNENKVCLVYNEKLEKVGSYELFYSPKSVVAVSEEEVAITSGSEYIVHFLHISKCNEITSDRTCKVKTLYDSICLKDDNQFVMGTINDKRPARIVSLTGNENDFSVNFPNKAYYGYDSGCTYINNSDTLVLTDRHEHYVYIYDIKTDTRVVVKDDQIQEPCGVAVGPSDTIIVCSLDKNSLVQISQTGHILSSHKIDIECPYRACVSRDKSFLVVTNDCYRK